MTDPIGHYLTSIGKVPLLTATDEIYLAKQVQIFKALLQSVVETNEFYQALAIKSDFNFKGKNSHNVRENISEEYILNDVVDPEAF